MTSLSGFLCHPLTVSLVDVRGDGDDRVEHIVDPVSFGESVLDECGQVFPVPDQLVVVAEPCATCVLFEQRHVVLDCLGPLP